MSVPALRRLYLETLASTARLLTENTGGDSPGWLEGEVDRLATLLAPAVATDTLAPFSFPDFEGNVRGLRGFLRTRPLYVDCAARAALESSEPQPCPLPVYVEIPQQTGAGEAGRGLPRRAVVRLSIPLRSVQYLRI
jgi:hypothetical protein